MREIAAMNRFTISRKSRISRILQRISISVGFPSLSYRKSERITWLTMLIKSIIRAAKRIPLTWSIKKPTIRSMISLMMKCNQISPSIARGLFGCQPILTICSRGQSGERSSSRRNEVRPRLHQSKQNINKLETRL